MPSVLEYGFSEEQSAGELIPLTQEHPVSIAHALLRGISGTPANAPDATAHALPDSSKRRYP
ncbi:hypothetical protein ACFWIB_33650, partial [Streptomyces sp. NPDC127051]|uniref:hypothetical protein n=1 Tax=Streptomyces sp. NPDC127051 TaxID=3347119 RepID=UPI00365A09F9